MRHILIGGHGFLGRETVRQILERPGDSAVVVDLPEAFEKHPKRKTDRIAYVAADIAEPGVLDRVGLRPDDVIHHMASRLIIPNRPRFGRKDTNPGRMERPGS